MNIYFISEINKKGNNAGSKARNDLELIFRSLDWEKINSDAIVTNSIKRNIWYFIVSFIGALKLYFNIILMKNSTIICQYPVLKASIIYPALRFAKRRNKLCFIIHDINGLRSIATEREKILKEEIKILNYASGIIVHNLDMRNYLENNGLKISNVEEIKLFDYLYSEEIFKERTLSKFVDYAGNLKKGTFIHKLCEYDKLNFHLNLYGSNLENSTTLNDYISYKGSFHPDEIANNLEGSFGLVWDGPSDDTCSGVNGEYLKYNNPHKLSLYIAAGLPVIVWSDAAVAKLVIKQKIGFVVESLSQIGEKIDNIDEELYNVYLENIRLLGQNVRNGNNTKMALINIMNKIN